MEKASAKSGLSGRLAPLLLLAFLALGIWARLVNAGSSASLWFDEVWRIQNLLDADSIFRQVVSPPNHIDPPLFSLAIYFLAQVWNTELVLRLVSIIPGVLVILAAYLVGRQLFTARWTALLAAFLVAFSPWMTIFSKELKPYSLGLLVHLTVLYGFLRYSRTPTTKAAATFTGLAVLSLFFSPNIVFAFPGICIILLALAVASGNRRRVAEALGAGASMLAASALYYFAFLHGTVFEQSFNPKTSSWFCPQGTVTMVAGWFIRRFLDFYSKMAFTDYSLFKGAGTFLEILYPLMALAGAAVVLYRCRRRFLQLICIFFMPFLVMVPFTILKLWPFGPLRMNLFLMVYIIFPPLFILDQWHGRGTRLSRPLAAGLTAALLMVLQYPVHFGEYAHSRVTTRQSAAALVNLIDYTPEHRPIPLLINATGKPSFAYYSQHHRTVSRRFSACSGLFEPRVLARKDSPLYTTGELLRECQKNRQVAIYLSQYEEVDRLLFQNEFSIEHHSFAGHHGHSCILDSELAGYQDAVQPVFLKKRFTGESEEWEEVCRTEPLPLADPIPGALVVVNFDLSFNSAGRSIRFRFIDQDGSGKPCAPSSIENSTPRIPDHIESAVHTRINQPVEDLRLVVEARGTYDLLLENVSCFMTDTGSPISEINPDQYPLRTGDRLRVIQAVTSLDDFWPDDTLRFGWTTGDSTITLGDLAVEPEATVLMLETFGWMPPRWREEMNRNGLRVYLNDNRRAPCRGTAGNPVSRYYFEVPSDIRRITSIRIISNTFIPRDLGLNDDARTLGIDVKSVTFPARAAARRQH